MGWVLLEIIVPLILAILAGLLIGWLLWRWRRTEVKWTEWEHLQSVSSTQTELDGQVNRLVGERDVSTARIAAQEAELVDLRGQVSTFSAAGSGAAKGPARNKADVDRIATLEARLADADGTTVGLRRSLEAAEASARELEGRIAAADARSAELEAANAQLTVAMPDIDATATSGLAGASGLIGDARTTLQSPVDPGAARADADSTLDLREGSIDDASVDLRAEGDDGGSDGSDGGGRTAVAAKVAPTDGRTTLVGAAIAPALADGATRHPYGEGSHGPLADKTAPSGYDIKGNVDSMLYHRPDSRNYGATVAEVWFDNPRTARLAGFAKARTHPDLSAADEATADHLGDTDTSAAKNAPLADGATRHPYGEGSHGPLADKTAPSGYDIKGNVDSMLYHRPDSRNYGATVAEVWFDNPRTARLAGFAKARTHPDLSAADEATADHLGDTDTSAAKTVQLPALADGATRHPYGEGSHGPLADRSRPNGYLVKGNVDSMLYHRPDSRNYGATVAEVWFETPETAEAAGFAKAPTHPNNR